MQYNYSSEDSFLVIVLFIVKYNDFIVQEYDFLWYKSIIFIKIYGLRV